MQKENHKHTLPDQLNLGDWVFTTDGKLRQILSDDMVDLKYETIDRMAMDEEIPWLNFKLGDYIGLNKEAFWDPLTKRCPYSTGIFCKWIADYKNTVNWNRIMGDKIEIHDLPFEMQYGVLCNFFNDTMEDTVLFTICERLDLDDNIMFIISGFVDMELEFRNDGIKDHW